MKKSRKYISNIKTLCEADIREGRRLILEERMKECILNEDYETCEGIKRALHQTPLSLLHQRGNREIGIV